ncbi:MAG: type II toxin-antitoxin system RelE/ParE family toxin [Bacteroidota bacterium]
MDENINPVLWTSRATKDLKKITFFYIDIYGKQKARAIATSIKKTVEILETTQSNLTAIGMIDESFTHLKREYRKIVDHHCKIRGCKLNSV